MKPDKMMLDWNWNGLIADFGQGIWLNNHGLPLLTHPNAVSGMPLLDSDYLAPE
jgi:hypothetical protein